MSVTEQVAELLTKGSQPNDGATQKAPRAPEEDSGEESGGDGSPGTAGDDAQEGAQDAASNAEEATEERGTEAEDAGSDEGERRPTLKETADRLKTSAKSLYEMEIPLNDGSGRYMSVEDLKAGYLAGEAGTLDAERHEFAREKAQHEAVRIEQENRVIQSTRELQQVLTMMTGALPAQQLEQLRGMAQEQQASERRKLVEMMPQFRDQTVYQGWLGKAEGLMKRYGFSEAEARNISDHRIYKMLDDFLRVDARLSELDRLAKGEPPPPRVVKRRTGKPAAKKAQAIDRAKQTGRRADQVTAVAALLDGAT